MSRKHHMRHKYYMKQAAHEAKPRYESAITNVVHFAYIQTLNNSKSLKMNKLNLKTKRTQQEPVEKVILGSYAHS